jgi:hypothetical protein
MICSSCALSSAVMLEILVKHLMLEDICSDYTALQYGLKIKKHVETYIIVPDKKTVIVDVIIIT